MPESFETTAERLYRERWLRIPDKEPWRSRWWRIEVAHAAALHQDRLALACKLADLRYEVELEYVRHCSARMLSEAREVAGG